MSEVEERDSTEPEENKCLPEDETKDNAALLDVAAEKNDGADLAPETPTTKAISSPDVIHSVSYAIFDTAIGNTIAATFPEEVDFSQMLETKAIADYCFPDGAHDFLTACVSISLRLKEGVPTPSYIPDQQRHIYGFATYHLKKDPEAHRGAFQRSFLILSWMPLYDALTEVAKVCIFPFLDSVHATDKKRHLDFCQHLLQQLKGCFQATQETIDVSLDPKGDGTNHLLGRRQRSRSESTFGMGATNLSRLGLTDYLHCGTRAVYLDIFSRSRSGAPTTSAGGTDRVGSANNSPGGSPRKHYSLDQPRFEDRSPEDEARRAPPLRGASSPSSPKGSILIGDAVKELHYEKITKKVHMRLPLSDATPLDQFSYGASVKKLIKWLGSNVAVVHWAFLCRIPVLFIGEQAEEVGEAVRACTHLLRMIEAVDVSRFAPFATIEHADYLRSKVCASPYLAIGTTNGFLRETEFNGVVKCDIMNGSVKFSNGKKPKLPKKINTTFNSLLSAANDPYVKEIYLRARLARLNIGIVQQFERKEGPFYECLKNSSNLIDTPMGRIDDESALQEAADSFMLVGEESSLQAGPNSPTNSASNRTSGRGLVSDRDLKGGDDGEENEWKGGFAEEGSVGDELHKALTLYKDAVIKNKQILTDLENWYGGICGMLHDALYHSSGIQQCALYDDMESFTLDPEKLHDPSLFFCGSSLADALETEQSLERAQRLRFSVDIKERCFLLVDSFCRNNPRVLRRKGNRLFSDFFNFPECALYGFPNQVLFHKSSGTLVTYHGRVKTKTSGNFYISKNFLCFEAGQLAFKKQHQIFPYDVITALTQERNGPILSPTIKMMFEFPKVAGTAGNDSEIVGSSMAVLSNLGSSHGFFEMLQLLFHRQKRLQKLVHAVPNLVGPRPAPKILTIPGGLTLMCPLVIPAGLYASSRQEYTEEVWENQRQYPIIGWSTRLMLSDPPQFSDFSGKRARLKESVTLPEGFEWIDDEWEIREGAVSDLIEDDENVQSSRPVAGGMDSPRGAPTADDKDRGFVYSTTWFTTEFKTKAGFGHVCRRRLWTRRRRLIPPPEGIDESSEQTLEAILASGELPRAMDVARSPSPSEHTLSSNPAEGKKKHVDPTATPPPPSAEQQTYLTMGSKNRGPDDDDLSTNSSDMVMVGEEDQEVLAPTVEEDNDGGGP